MDDRGVLIDWLWSAIEALPDPEPRSNGSGPITHKIVQNRLALGGEESVCVGHRRYPAAGSIRRTHHAHLHHRQ